MKPEFGKPLPHDINQMCDNCGLDSNQICEDCHIEIENIL